MSDFSPSDTKTVLFAKIILPGQDENDWHTGQDIALLATELTSVRHASGSRTRWRN